MGRAWGRPGWGLGGGFASERPPRPGHRQVLGTGLPCSPNLHLLVACAILDMERDTLMLLASAPMRSSR